MTEQYQYILSFLVEEFEFERMKELECRHIDHSMTYAEFHEWNTLCLSEQAPDYDPWLLRLCQLMKDNQICLMDLESCAVFEACAFFYDKNKRLCIINPR
jgi:hypothetical protein